MNKKYMRSPLKVSTRYISLLYIKELVIVYKLYYIIHKPMTRLSESAENFIIAGFLFDIIR